MNAETLTALQDSIEHWRRMANGDTSKGDKPFSTQCALCQLFIRTGCTNCPVAEYTKQRLCKGSPYSGADHAFGVFGVTSPQFRAYAQAELEFLESLLPSTNNSNANQTKDPNHTNA